MATRIVRDHLLRILVYLHTISSVVVRLYPEGNPKVNNYLDLLYSGYSLSGYYGYFINSYFFILLGINIV